MADEQHLSEGERRLLATWKLDHPVQRKRAMDQLPYTPNRRTRPRIPRVPEPKPGTIAAVINEVEQCGPSLSSERAARWAAAFFTPDQVRAWLEVGLRTADLDLIINLREVGVPAEAITWRVNKETILDRIRIRGYSAHEVTQTLQKAGMLPSRSA